MQWCGLGQPDVAVDASAFVETAVPQRGIHAHYQCIARAVMYEVSDVEAKGRVAVVVPSDEGAVHEYERAAKRSVEFEHDAPTEVARWNVETPAIPAHGRLGIVSADGLV